MNVYNSTTGHTTKSFLVPKTTIYYYKAYLSPETAHAAQELAEVRSCLINSPAGGQVVAGGHHTDCVGCPRYNGVQQLGPQLRRACPRS